MSSILVIDDADSFREIVARLLRTEGYSVLTAANGREGLGVLEGEKPDLILLDLLMPEMDGLAFLQAMRANPQWQGIRVVILTALTEGDMLTEARKLVTGECMLKARFSLPEFFSTVKQYSTTTPA